MAGPVAGGIYNPATNEIMLGAIDSGVWYNGRPARCSQRTALQGSLILASRARSTVVNGSSFKAVRLRSAPWAR
jgi:fructose-1,6-bisphosphatase/inositol monophosphatase family enzyme